MGPRLSDMPVRSGFAILCPNVEDAAVVTALPVRINLGNIAASKKHGFPSAKDIHVNI